jgi:DNA-binding response OmpR family regulator
LENNLVKVSDLEIDHERMSVVRGGKSIFLTPKEYNLLCFMVENKGKVLSRTSILRHIWDSPLDILATTVDVNISILRKKIDKDFNTKLIHTVSGVGYKLDIIKY